MKIGPIEVDPPVVLAPMAGVTDLSFRQLCRGFGAGLYVSEMIATRALVERNPKTLHMLASDDQEPLRSVQLYGVDPSVTGRAVRMLVDEIGVDHIDLNFGCPAAKVTAKGGGAALPLHHLLFRSIVRAAVAAAGAVPVTVKLRMGVDARHLTAVPAGQAAEDEGAAAVALHARTAEQLYSGRATWTAIGELKSAVRTIPVLGNGDIWEAADARRMMAETGCDGVVIGRGCLGRPWLFRDLADAFAGRPLQTPPSLGETAALVQRHGEALCAAFGEVAGMRRLRKHTSWYLTGFPVGGERRRLLSRVATLDELASLLDDLDPSIAFPAEAHRTTRGHSHGPRPVALPAGWLESADDPTPPVGADDVVSGG